MPAVMFCCRHFFSLFAVLSPRSLVQSSPNFATCSMETQFLKIWSVIWATFSPKSGAQKLPNFRGALDPEFCYPARSGSTPDPDMSDPDQNRILFTWIRLLPTTREKLLFLHHNWKKLKWLFTLFCDRTSTLHECLTLTVLNWNDWASEFSHTVLYCQFCHASFPGMKKCCDVLCHSYVDAASIYRILPQIRPDPDPNRIQIHWI